MSEERVRVQLPAIAFLDCRQQMPGLPEEIQVAESWNSLKETVQSHLNDYML